MTATSTYTMSSTFTISHARHISSKIAADLDLCTQYYGKPSRSRIPDYAEELATMLRGGYVSSYEFGFKRNDERVVCWQYSVRSDGTVDADDNAGKLCSYAEIAGSVYYNFMTYSSNWFSLSDEERKRIKLALPIHRSDGHLPTDGDGHWVVDKQYSANGVGTTRRTFRPSVS